MPPCPQLQSGFRLTVATPGRPLQQDQGEKAFTRPRFRPSEGPPWERRRPRRLFLPSHLKSLHFECPSMGVRAVIQAVVVAGLRMVMR